MGASASGKTVTDGADSWVPTWFGSDASTDSTSSSISRMHCVDGDGNDHVFMLENGQLVHIVDEGSPSPVKRVSIQRQPKSSLIRVNDSKEQLRVLNAAMEQVVFLSATANVPLYDSSSDFCDSRSMTATNTATTISSRPVVGALISAREFLDGGGARAAKDLKGYMVMGSYMMHLEDQDLCGEGSSSICRRGTHLGSGRQVAIKYYKPHDHLKKKKGGEDLVVEKFRRQVKVLRELQEPLDLTQVVDEGSSAMWQLEPSEVFVQMLDFSRNANGEPDRDPQDGTCYIVMELADYSLQDYLCICSDQGFAPRKEIVRRIAQALVNIVAALHARGLAHLDLKPANFMIFDGQLKLIDVDGCIPVGSVASLHDDSLSCSPAYVSPEWATFCSCEEENPEISITAALDIWSLGMIICELVTLEPVMAPIYRSLAKQQNCQNWPLVTYLFYNWLSSQTAPPLPVQKLEDFDLELADFARTLCAINPVDRQSVLSLAEAVPFLSQGSRQSSKRSCTSSSNSSNNDSSAGISSNASTTTPPSTLGQVMTDPVRNFRHRVQNRKLVVPHHGQERAKGPVRSALWKLKTLGDPTNKQDWQLFEMWLTPNGSLMFWSRLEEKPILYYSKKDLTRASLQLLPEKSSCKAFSFVIQLQGGSGGKGAWEAGCFAADTEQLLKLWTRELSRITSKTKPTSRPSVGASTSKAHPAVRNTTRSVKIEKRVTFMGHMGMGQAKSAGPRARE